MTSVFTQIRCKFPNISYLSETQKNNVKLLNELIHFCFSENIASDCFHGCFVVTCTLCAFISLVWLREQILHGGGPDWLEQDIQGGHARVSNHHCDVGPDTYIKKLV